MSRELGRLGERSGALRGRALQQAIVSFAQAGSRLSSFRSPFFSLPRYCRMLCSVCNVALVILVFVVLVSFVALGFCFEPGFCARSLAPRTTAVQGGAASVLGVVSWGDIPFQGRV